jgi:hypothetical protein
MALTAFEQGSVIFRQGEPLRSLAVIAKGSAEASYFGNTFRFEPGDMIGVCDFSAGTHGHTVTAVTDITVITYPCYGFHALDALLSDNADAANLMVNSLCRQITGFLQYWAAFKHEAGHVYTVAQDFYAEYTRLCGLYAFTAKKLPGLADAQPFPGPDPIEDWLHDFYVEIHGMDPAIRKDFFFKKPGVTSGFLRRGTDDVVKVIASCRAYHAYLTGLSALFLNDSGHDLFALITELHVNSLGIKGADEAVAAFVSRLTGELNVMTGIVPVQYQQRLDEYTENLSGRRERPAEMTGAPAAAGVKQNLSDSFQRILEYSGCAEEFGNRFARCVQNYAGLPDRNDSEDAARALRKELTMLFHELYLPVMVKSITQDPNPPTIIKMFLNFGYADAKLAGPENADFLYSIADALKGDPAAGVYTLREWLTAIYTGQKEPSRNEFDMDYPEHVHKLKQEKKLDNETVLRMMKDQDAKLCFEMANVLPTSNKITFGRIITYCPLFADHNIQRNLEDSLVKPEALKAAFDEIRSIDHSAYYRETLYSNSKLEIKNTALHIEILPDVILTPIVGSRGAMWQEIEGIDRATPARMFMPIFFESELKALALRLTGEFRWEMCKRVQGMRWNDVSEPSLTSEYSDFLQFYKTNKTLSPEAKEDLKADLSRARNNYKTVFVNDYREWILYEANTSPRLNKAALAMMVTYCPFAKPIREKMMQHPRYSELLTRYNFKQMKRIQFIERIVQRLTVTGKPVPKEIKDELDYAKR